MSEGKSNITKEQVQIILNPLVASAKEYQEELSTKRDEFYKYYRAEPYGNERDGWAKTVHPTIFNVIEWLKPHLYEIFTGDFFSFEGEDEKSAERMKDYVRFKLFTQQAGDQKIEDFIHYCLVSHYGIFKVYHRDDYKNRKKQFKRLAADEMSQLVALDDVEVTKYDEVKEVDPLTGEPQTTYENVSVKWQETKYKGPWLETLKPSAYYELPGYPEINDNPFVAHVEARTLDYIRKREAEGVYLKGSAEKCKVLIQQRYGTVESEGEDNDLFNADDISTPDWVNYTNEESIGNAKVEVWECYCKLDIDGDGYLEDSIVWLADGLEVLREPIVNEYGSPPFVKGSIYREPHKPIGRPIPDMLDTWQRVETNLIRAIQDSAMLSANRGFLTTDARTQDALQKWSPGMTARVSTLQDGSFRQVDFGAPNQFIFKAWELTTVERDKSSGVNEAVMGIDKDAMNKTAAGMHMKLNATQAREVLYARRLARAFKEVLRKVIKCISLYPPEDDIRVVGKDIALQPDDPRGEYIVQIDVGVGSQNNMFRAQLMDQHLQFLIQAGIPMGIADQRHVLRTLERKYDYLDINSTDLMKSEAQFEQEQIQRQQAQPPQPGPGQIPGAVGPGAGPSGNPGQPPIPGPGQGVPPNMGNGPQQPGPPIRSVQPPGGGVPIPNIGPR